MVPRRLAWGVALAVSMTTASSAASVPDSYGFGSRASAMAGAVAADSTSFAAGYYNPAGLVGATGVSLSLGYMHNEQRLMTDGRDNEVAAVHGLVGGLVAPGSLFGLPFAFGFALHLPDDGLSYIHARREQEPRWELYDTRGQLLYLAATVAVRPWPWLQVGGGMGYLSATRGRFGIRGRADIISPYDSDLEHTVDADLTSVRFPLAGLRLSRDGWGALGIVYRGESQLDLGIGATLDGIVEFAGIDIPLLYDLEAHTISAFTPQQLVIAFSLQRFDDWHLNVDLTWMNWAAYRSPTAEIEASLEVDPPPGTPIALPDQPLPARVLPPGFRNTIDTRLGLEYQGIGWGAQGGRHATQQRAIELPLRAGYAFAPSPIPPQTGVSNYLDADRHTVSAGLGLVVNAPFTVIDGSLKVSVHGAWSRLPERRTMKESPADFVGDYTASGQIWSLGADGEVVF